MSVQSPAPCQAHNLVRLIIGMSFGISVVAGACKSDDKGSNTTQPATQNPSISGSVDNKGSTDSDPLTAPCDFYTAEDAVLMGDAKPIERQNFGSGSVSICRAGGFTFARFEKISLDNFTSLSCKSPLQEVAMLPDFGEAACSFGGGTTGVTAVAVYYKGWSLQVGNNSIEKCKEVLQRIMDRLPGA